jgi:hypothetical protein
LLYAINYLYNKDEMKQIYDFPSWWFPDKGTEVVDGYMALFPAIARLVDNLAFYQKLLIIKEDEPLYKSALAKAQAKDFPPVAPDEQDAQPVITITDPNFAQHAGRPIVFATNYASILRVVGITPEGKSYNLPTFAAEGPLLGSFVAEGIKEIKITAVHPHTSWSKYMPPLGGVLLLMVAGWWLALIRRPKGIGKMDA